jgi:4-amino-4-deoxy-L-arabinose transferase-like glycosyltransferase
MVSTQRCGRDEKRLWARHVVWVIVATAILRVVFASSLGLGVDESYTVATARHLELGYFDHPPLTWWLAWAARGISGSEAALPLRLPFIALCAVTTWLMFAATRALFGERAGFWAAASFNMAPVLAWTSGTWILPDGPLDAALMAGAFCVGMALWGPGAASATWWLAAGASGGLALLAKLHGALLFAGVGLFLLTSPAHRRWLASPWPYAGVLLALLLFLPVLVWNAENGWITFAFQASRAQPQQFKPWAPLMAVAGQALYLLPWLWLPLVLCLARAIALGPADDCRWLLACLAVGPIVFFTLVALVGRPVLPHWAAPGYLLVFPLLGAEIAEAIDRGERYVRPWLIGTALSMLVVLATVVALAYAPWPGATFAASALSQHPLLEAVDWDDLEPELRARGLWAREGLVVVTTRWHEAAKIDYALHGRMPVLCLSRDPRGYGIVARGEDHLGADALIIGRELSRSSVVAALGSYFASFEQLPPIRITHAGEPVLELSVLIGHSLRSPSERPSLLDPLSLRLP